MNTFWNVITGKTYVENKILGSTAKHFHEACKNYAKNNQYKGWLEASIAAAYFVISSTFIYNTKLVRELTELKLEFKFNISFLKQTYKNDPNDIKKAFQLIFVYMYGKFISGGDCEKFQFNKDQLLSKLLETFKCSGMDGELVNKIVLLPMLPGGGIFVFTEELCAILNISKEDVMLEAAALAEALVEGYNILVKLLRKNR